jgi:hypothetical protein
MKLVSAFLIVLVSVMILSTTQCAPDSLLKNNATFVIVKSAEMMKTGIASPNAAILISDSNDIKFIESLFHNNHNMGHACGYHYEISFWGDPLIRNMYFPFNQECEEFHLNNRAIQNLMQGYIKILENEPPNYIFNLKVLGTVTPNDVSKKLKDAGIVHYFDEGITNHYASLTINYQQISPIKSSDDRSAWQREQSENRKFAEQKMDSIVRAIEQIATILEKSPLTLPMESFGGGRIEALAEITLKFKLDDDLALIKTLVLSSGATIKKEMHPEHYTLQIVESANNLNLVKQKVKHLDFVEEVW